MEHVCNFYAHIIVYKQERRTQLTGRFPIEPMQRGYRVIKKKCTHKKVSSFWITHPNIIIQNVNILPRKYAARSMKHYSFLVNKTIGWGNGLNVVVRNGTEYGMNNSENYCDTIFQNYLKG